MKKFVNSESNWMLAHDQSGIYHDALPVGVYTVKVNLREYYLEEHDPFVLPPKLYGKSTVWASRILNTFRVERPQSLGVLLSGLKGSGKTLLSKSLSIQMDAPTLLVNEPYFDDKFMDFLARIAQPATIIFDEFEKVYRNKEMQDRILTLFDGVNSLQNKLLVLTCNDKYSLREHFHNRPGRLRYSLDFGSLEEGFIREYCEENLTDQGYTKDVVRVAAVCSEFNFDMLQALVRELNMYGGPISEIVEVLNVKPPRGSQQQYEAVVTSPNLIFSNERVASPMAALSMQESISMWCTVKGTLPSGEKVDTSVDIRLESKDLKKVDLEKSAFEFETILQISPQNEDMEDEDEEDVGAPAADIIVHEIPAKVLITAIRPRSILDMSWSV